MHLHCNCWDWILKGERAAMLSREFAWTNDTSCWLYASLYGDTSGFIKWDYGTNAIGSCCRWSLLVSVTGFSNPLRMVHVYGFVTNHKKKKKRTNCNKCGLKSKIDSKFLLSLAFSKQRFIKDIGMTTLGEGGGGQWLACNCPHATKGNIYKYHYLNDLCCLQIL